MCLCEFYAYFQTWVGGTCISILFFVVFFLRGALFDIDTVIHNILTAPNFAVHPNCGAVLYDIEHSEFGSEMPLIYVTMACFSLLT